jgi:streptomycin 6-kinase
MMHLPSRFIDNIHRVFGDAGRQWLTRLPGIVVRCRAKWRLRDGVTSPDMSLNYLEFTNTDAGEAVALKIGVPHAELLTEVEALRLCEGRRVVRMLDADRELCAILMQRLQPGTMLRELGDNREETKIAASVMRELPAPVPSTHNLPTFARWVDRAFRLTRTEWDPQELMPRHLIDSAEVAFDDIERNATDQVVLHGDLHHENILLDDRSGWTAIDPKGVIGPRCLEVGRFIHNQLPRDLPIERRVQMVQERLAILSTELALPQKTLAASALVDCVLALCWGLEDESVGPDWQHGTELARELCGMLGSNA